MSVRKIVNDIASNPSLLNKPLRDVLTEAQLSMSLCEFIKALPSNLPPADAPLDEMPLEFMLNYLSGHPRVRKLIVIDQKGYPARIHLSEKVVNHHYTYEKVVDCVRAAFKPYQAEARKELAQTHQSWDHLISSINQKGL